MSSEFGKFGVTGALFYLRSMSLKNAVVSRVARLKQPKYLVGGIVGAAYFYFAFFRRFQSRRGPSIAGVTDVLGNDTLPMALTLGSSALLIIFLLFWIWPRARASLGFTLAEIDFLFPAPIRRRTLIQYRLISSQLRLLFTALMLALVSSNWSFIPGNAFIRIAGWWIIFATSSLHLVGSSFVIDRLFDRGVTSLRRQLTILGVAIVVIGALVYWALGALHTPSASDRVDVSSIAAYVSNVLSSGPLPWLLFPFKLMLQPLLAVDAISFAAAFWPALLVLAGHYLWILSVEVSFEEASISSAEKRAAKLAAFRDGKGRLGRSAPKARSAPFDIASTRRPELAFLWKNLLSTAGYLRPRTALIAAAIIVLGCNWLASQADMQSLRSAVAIIAMTFGGYVLLLGPQLARQDLRSDLLNTDILKTYPLRGWQIVFGQILTPIAIVTVLLWLVLLAVALSFQAHNLTWLTPSLRAGVAIYLALIAPLLCALQILVVNTAAILFPAWLQTTANRGSRGIEVMGQRIFFLAGQLVVVIATLVPATFVAGTVYFSAQWVVGTTIAIVLGALAVLAILLAEVCLGVAWLGGRFERFDLSAELRA